jgi:rare lipoprotein A
MKNIIILLVLVITPITFINADAFIPIKKVASNRWKGIASYYHNKFNGRKTSSGEIFSNSKLTAANNFLKLGTLVKVTNIENGLSVFVKINDRMHKTNKRLIDLSYAAAKHLGFTKKGLAIVEIEVIDDKNDKQ